MMLGKVYINHGRVIVDCPYNCKNAYLVKPRDKKMLCKASDGCHVVFDLDVPENLSELVTELDRRPKKETRNWFPEDHPLAVRGRLPMGQSVADLRAEFEIESGEGGV